MDVKQYARVGRVAGAHALCEPRRRSCDAGVRPELDVNRALRWPVRSLHPPRLCLHATQVLHALHNAVTGVEFLRVAMGAGARTRDLPPRVTDYQPDENDVGGFFDNTARAKKSWEGKKPGGGGKKGAQGKGGKAAAAGGEGGAVDKVLPSVPEGTAVKA